MVKLLIGTYLGSFYMKWSLDYHPTTPMISMSQFQSNLSAFSNQLLFFRDQLFKNIMRDQLDMTKVKAEHQLSNECIDLLHRLLEKDPSRRIGTQKGAIEIR